MIISRTPFRISFFGGGTDYPAWYRAHGGAVLATTIDKYCYLTCRRLPPFFAHRYRVVYSRMENCQTVDEISHPTAREVLRYFRDVASLIGYGLEIHHDADLPARSGLGSSSSFTVGLLHSLYGLAGRMPSKRQLALESIHIEQERLQETVGSQDQVSAAYGGLNHIAFLPNGEITVTPVTLRTARLSELEAHLMLFYTGIVRTASVVAETYAHDLDSKERQLHLLGAMVEEGIAILSGDGAITPFGQLLHEGWRTKQSLSESISSAHIQDIYETALGAGAVGGKLLGAGGGGFMLFFVPPSRQREVRRRLRGLLHVPMRLESSGSQIIFYSPGEEYVEEEQEDEEETNNGAGSPRL